MIGTLSPVGLQGFERRLERLVEGTFTKAFRSGLQPVEIGHRITRVLDDGRTMGVDGDRWRPTTSASTSPPPTSSASAPSPTSSPGSWPRPRASTPATRGTSSSGPVTVTLVPDDTLRTGDYDVVAEIAEGAGGQSARWCSPTAAGSRWASTRPRSAASPTAPSTSPTPASRRHAEIRPSADGFVVVDLGSMNGTKVNGAAVREQRAARRRRDLGRRDRDALRGVVVPESVLTILKFCFLALLYLFLFRVVRVVVQEMRAPAPAPQQAAAVPRAAPVGRGEPGQARQGRGSGHLRILEPPARQGETLPARRRDHRRPRRRVRHRARRRHVRVTVHARVFRRDGDVYVEDLGSRNGTCVNGEPLDRRRATAARRPRAVRADRRRGRAVTRGS